MEEDLRKLTKSNNRKKAAIIILLFALVLAGIAIFVLVFNKDKEEPKKEENKQEEKQEEKKEEEEEEEQVEDNGKVTFNGKEYTIRVDEDLNGYPVTYLNEKRIDGIGASRVKAMNGYLLLIYDGGQFGSDFVFLDDELNLLPIDIKYYYTSYKNGDYGQIFDFSNNKVKAGFINSNNQPGTAADFSIGNLYIFDNEGKSECTGELKKVSLYKDTVEAHKNDIVTGKIEFSYNNHKISYNYIEKKTVWDYLGKTLTNDTTDYCIMDES